MIWIIVLGATVFATLAIGIRAQIAATRGFDLALGASILISAESFIFVSSTVSGISLSLILGIASAFISAMLVMLVWNLAVVGLLHGRTGEGTNVLVASMGIVTATSGFVGAIRGPGLRQTPTLSQGLEVMGQPLTVILGIVIPTAAICLILAAIKGKYLTALEAYSMAPDFAVEVGISPRAVSCIAGITSGLTAGAAGIHFAVLDGSRTGLALTPVLYGICGALLFQRKTITSALIGGVILGATFTASQFVLDFHMSQLILFLGIALLLVIGSSSRKSEGVR